MSGSSLIIVNPNLSTNRFLLYNECIVLIFERLQDQVLM